MWAARGEWGAEFNPGGGAVSTTLVGRRCRSLGAAVPPTEWGRSPSATESSVGESTLIGARRGGCPFTCSDESPMSRRPGGTGAQMPPPRIRAATGDSAGPPSARSGRGPLAADDDDEAIFHVVDQPFCRARAEREVERSWSDRQVKSSQGKSSRETLQNRTRTGRCTHCFRVADPLMCVNVSRAASSAKQPQAHATHLP